MRILVHEFASGGGLAGRDVPPSLAREGRAMLAAVLADLSAIGRHQVVTTLDPRFPLAATRGVDVVRLSDDATQLDELIASADAVWLIAPETHRHLERLTDRVERQGKHLIGSSADAIRQASNKARLPLRLRRAGVPHPTTRVLRPGADGHAVAAELNYPVIVKPALGAGCEGVCLVRSPRALGRAARAAYTANGLGPLVMQEYVVGTAASVSLLTDGRHAVPLSVNAQRVRASFRLAYRGGQTVLQHPLADLAVVAAVRACSAFPGLRGYVGVDLVLTDSDAIVIEVNPRLTTAYIGVRATLEDNVAALTLAACAGVLPRRPSPRRRVRFTAAGRLQSITSLECGSA